MSVVVHLDPWEFEWASHVATRRNIENWGRKDAPHYDRSRMEDDRTAQTAACVCELAVAKATNRYWSGHVWPARDHEKHRDSPDVGRNIEVRRLRTGDNGAVRRHQVGKGLVLFVARPVMPEMTSVEILGWLEYDQAWDLGKPSKYDPDNTRLISPDYLKAVNYG